MTCGFGTAGGPIYVRCNTVGGDLESVSCNYDNGKLVEVCKWMKSSFKASMKQCL